MLSSAQARSSPNQSSFLTGLALTACWLVPVLALLVAVLPVTHGWDDGVITAAFARTFAHVGKLAVTPYSEQVEGFSSVSWMMVLAAGDTIFHSLTAMLAWTKIASAIAFSSALFVFFRLASRFLHRDEASLAVLLLAVTLTPIREIINGMEMNFYMLLVLLLATLLLAEHSYPRRVFALSVLLSFIVLSTRFEAPGVLFFLYLGVFGVLPKKKRILIALSVADIGYFALSELLRHRLFGLWLPNTIVAKQWAPYTTHSAAHALLSRVVAVAEPIIVLAAPLLALALLFYLQRSRTNGVSRAQSPLSAIRSTALWPLLLSMTVGALAVNLVIGRNWGHPGRMSLAFLPFIILLIVTLYRRLLPDAATPKASFLCALVLGQMLTSSLISVSPLRLDRVSAASVEASGLAADDVRQALHRETLSALIPDIGASSLCCEKLNVIDSALLANRQLAAHGYAGLKPLIATEPPDVIETHMPWSALGGYYSQHLLDGYDLVLAHRKYIFVRASLYQQLLAEGYLQYPTGENTLPCAAANLPDALPVRSELDPADLAYLQSKPACLLLGSSGP